MFGRKKLRDKCQRLEEERDQLAALLLSISEGLAIHIEKAESMDDASKYRYVKTELALDVHYILDRTKSIIDKETWQLVIEDCEKECKKHWDEG